MLEKCAFKVSPPPITPSLNIECLLKIFVHKSMEMQDDSSEERLYRNKENIAHYIQIRLYSLCN